MTRILALIAAVFAASHALVEADGDCTSVPESLTWECGGLCDEYIPCLVYNASDCETSSGDHSASCTNDDDGVCAYTCFTNFYADGYAYLLIRLSDSSSSSSGVTAIESEPDEASWVYDDAITSIDVPSISPLISTVYFQGGTETISGSTSANVTLTDRFRIGNDTVTTVQLSSINLSQVDDLLSLFPERITELTVSGSGLQTLEAGEDQGLDISMAYNSLAKFSGSFPVLTSLYLDSNALTNFIIDLPTLTSLSLSSNLLTNFSGDYPALIELFLDNNSVTNFTGDFPALDWLDLTNNSLARIPDAVFSTSTLAILYISGNPFEGMPTFTRAQVSFLQGLDELDLQAADFAESVDCGNTATTNINTFNVCVLDAVTASSSGISGSAIAGIVVGAVVVVAVVVAGLVWRRRSRSLGNGGSNSQNLLTAELTQRSEIGGLWNDEQLQALRVDAHDIEDVRKIGSGAFGEVWLVRYRSTQLLASKRLLTKREKSGSSVNPSSQSGSLQRFIEEIKLVSTLDHSNIVVFMGAAWAFHSDVQALFEYMENGDLRDYLIKNKPNSDLENEKERLSAEAFKLQIACDIVDALVYVHSFAPPVVHRDLKSRNVLISSDWRAKVTDFGCARVQSENATMTAGVGTGRWLAPEILTGSNDYGTAADIYAFGVMLAEMDTHLIPYDDARSADDKRPLANVAIL